MKMKLKNLLVSFLTIVSVLFLVATVSAANEYTITKVEINDIVPTSNDSTAASATTGETIKIEVWFTADFNATEDDGEDFYDSDVTVEAELDTGKKKANSLSESMIIESGNEKKVTLTLKVPYELKDELSKLVDLTIEIDGEKYEVSENYKLRVERVQYNVDVKSVSTINSVEAGEIFPVDIVLKNIGYKDLDDVYVTASISALGIGKSSYFGDLVALECDNSQTGCNEDDEDTVSGRLYLKVPYDVEAGIYTLEIEVTNDDASESVVKQITIENDFSNNVIVGSYKKSVSAGEDAEYDLLIVNPTNKLKVYKVVIDSSKSISTSSSDDVVAVAAGTSRTVKVTANAETQGEYNFDVNVFSGEELISTATLSADVEGKTSGTNPITVLTVILAIIFIVLLIVLIVLIGKKPEKAEEFGESYY